MLNNNSLQAIQKNTKEAFVYPAYGSYCFAHIPDTISSLLGLSSKQPLPQDAFVSDDFDDVVFLFIDGFGWKFFEQYDLPFLKRFVNEGIASKITSQFPSTTAAHVTCINTGLPVAESGIYEWFQYEPEVDEIITPLVFSCAGDKEADSLKRKKISPQKIYPFTTFYERLEKENVTSHIFMDNYIIDSVYSLTMSEGAKRIGFANVSEGLNKLLKIQAMPSEKKRYFYFYIGDIDAVGHRHGTYSSEFESCIKDTFAMLEAWLEKAKGSKRKTALLVTADHGMTDIDPKGTIYLNEELPSITEVLRKNRAGKPLVPAGSCRDFFLHVEDERLLDTKEMLEKLLKDKALVVETDFLIKEGIFGTKTISKRLQDRIGNLVILPTEHQGVWWHEKGRFGQHFFAMHGGLSAAEMESIFLFYRF